MRRQFLGKMGGFLVRTRAYLASDAVEVDEIEGYTGSRRRVLLDEVLLITLDRRRRWPSITASLVAAAALLVMFLAMWLSYGRPELAVMGSIVAAPFALIGAVQWAAGADHVTVFGKRGVAQVAFLLRKRRAREVFALLKQRVQEAQEKARAGKGVEEPAAGGPASVA